MDSVGIRAEEAAANFVASLGVESSAREAAIVFNTYVAGWIQGAYAGANEARPNICKRRTSRRGTSCIHNAKG